MGKNLLFLNAAKRIVKKLAYILKLKTYVAAVSNFVFSNFLILR